ncbi:beta-ketoacyl-ACP synthase III [Tomitella biformata]|uniref:beta-ketoacyl-ACP synthase III n=1 Tax=Tomitella biformata TaxID=630403 RepID=UPI0004672FF2|nr:beta-ketoacyl-ACP synthase III [Tomitella biformata]
MSVSITPSVGTHSKIIAIGAYRPERIVTNDEICETIDSTDEWIQTRSGIKSRHFAAEDENVVDMCVEAAKKAIAVSGLAVDQIDCIIIATNSHYNQTPQAATLVAHRLGLNKPGSFDLAAGCAGFSHGLAVASDLIRGGSAKHVLLVGADHMSVGLDMTDRSTAFIFGDGAGAVIVGPSDVPEIGPVVWGSDGEQSVAIRQEPTWMEIVRSGDYSRPALHMEGQAVFRWAAFSMGKVARQTLEVSGVTIEDLDAFIPHQANQRITEVLCHSLKLPETLPVADDIVTTANTSSGSIPLAMEAMLRDGKAKPGGLALLVGFGAGLAFAGQVVRLPKFVG